MMMMSIKWVRKLTRSVTHCIQYQKKWRLYRRSITKSQPLLWKNTEDFNSRLDPFQRHLCMNNVYKSVWIQALFLC